MSLIFLSTLTIALAATLILASSPLFLGIWIILITLVLRIVTNLISITWLSLIIILIYIGGLLVIFAYFVALTPNLIVEGKSIVWGLTLSFPVFYTIIFALLYTDQKVFSSTSQHPIRFLFIEHIIIIFLLALILFFALVATVKIVSNTSAPLRPFKKYVYSSS